MTISNGKAAHSSTNRIEHVLADTPRSLPPAELGTDTVREQMAIRPQANIRAIRPCAVVCLGGAGNEVGCRTKRGLLEQDTHKFVEFLSIDTDANAQTGSGFTDDEFCLVRTERIKNVIDHPEMHETLVDRFDLNDAEVLAFGQSLLRSGIDQAGQVRSFGANAFLSDHASMRVRVSALVQRLNGSLVRLQKQLDSKNEIRIRERMRIYLLFSAAGGTGSSMALEMVSLFRDMTSGLDVELVGICLAPSTFRAELEGRPEQWTRVKANGYGTLQEISAMTDGFSQRHDLNFGPDKHNPMALSAGCFNQLFIVGRQTADGRDLGSADAVYDMVANWLTAEIGTELSDALELLDANESTLRGLTVDPMTQKPRDVSTLGATALSMDARRIRTYCTQSALIECLKRFSLGPTPESTVIDQATKQWLARPCDQPNVTLSDIGLVEMLKLASMPRLERKGETLFDAKKRNQRMHFGDRIFAQRFVALRARIDRELMPKCDLQLERCKQSLVDSLTNALRSECESQKNKHGFSYLAAFTSVLTRTLQKQIASLNSSSENDRRQACDQLEALDANVAALAKRRLKITKSKTRQSGFAGELVLAYKLAATAKAMQASAEILGVVATIASNFNRDANERCLAVQEKIAACNQQRESLRHGRRITTESLAEIDVTCESTDEQLYRYIRPDWSVVRPKDAIFRPCEDARGFDRLAKHLEAHFRLQLNKITIVDLLAGQLTDPQTAPEAMAKIRQAMLGAQPAWQAESGNNAVEFADSVIAGVPEATSDSNRKLVVHEMMQAAVTLNPNSQYRASAQHVVTGDKHKIYICRRTHGGCWHYLPEVRECERAYQEWNRNGGHSVHIFNRHTIAKMPPILPPPKAKPAELALAIGLAYGFVAKRGPHYYENLTTSADGTYMCPLKSHWPTVRHKSAKGEKPNALEVLIDKGRLVFMLGHDLEKASKLGETLLETLTTLNDQKALTHQILSTFDELRALVGDAAVSEELDEHVAQLMSPEFSDTRKATTVRHLVDVIAEQARMLR